MENSKRIEHDLHNTFHLLQCDDTVCILLFINQLIGTIGYSGQKTDSQAVPIK